MAATILTSVFAHGGRTSRYGEFVMVYMHGSSFITTPMEFMQMQNWARARVSTGNPVRDRSLFVDRFDTVLGRAGGGVATKGSPMSLARIVKAMKANAVFMEEWSVPRNLDQGVEMRKPKTVQVAGGPARTSAAAAETVPDNVVPLLPK